MHTGVQRQIVQIEIIICRDHLMKSCINLETNCNLIIILLTLLDFETKITDIC